MILTVNRWVGNFNDHQCREYSEPYKRRYAKHVPELVGSFGVGYGI